MTDGFDLTDEQQDAVLVGLFCDELGLDPAEIITDYTQYGPDGHGAKVRQDDFMRSLGAASFRRWYFVKKMGLGWEDKVCWDAR